MSTPSPTPTPTPTPTPSPTPSASIDDQLEAIRAAVASDATADQKAHGALACRAILAALDAEPGRPLAVPGAPAPHPLAGLDAGTALDLLIARLTAALPASPTPEPTPTGGAPPSRPLKITFVSPPAGRSRGPTRKP